MNPISFMYKKIGKFYGSREISNPNYIWTLREKALKNPIGKFKYYNAINKCNSFLPLTVHFEDQPTFPHGFLGIFISNGAKIGKGCTIFHQVTIGSNTLSDSSGFGAPTIGDNVYIGCGAKIIGNVHIGNNVRIGANCVIVTDIPDNATVVLEKPRIIVSDGPRDNKFKPYK